MKFKAQIKEVKRLSTVSNDTEYSVKFLTEENLKDLMEIPADKLVEVQVERTTKQ